MFKFCFFITALSLSSLLSAKALDPTRPLGLSNEAQLNEAKKELILESIIHGDQLHTVVISGKVLKPGQYIGKYRLVAVNDDSVVLRSATERLKLHIFSRVIVK